MTRYASQTGHHVQRRFGWDCHGLPVEYEIDKKLGVVFLACRLHVLCRVMSTCSWTGSWTGGFWVKTLT